MIFIYRKAQLADLDLLVTLRSEVLCAANLLAVETDMSLLELETRRYYQESFHKDNHVAYLVMAQNELAGCGGISFYQVMPTYHNPTGRRAYIMNMYTRPPYRKQGVAAHVLDLLVGEAKARGIGAISLEATAMGRPLYLHYGFQPMEHEMELVSDE